MNITKGANLILFLAYIFACWNPILAIEKGDANNAMPISQIVKLKHLAVILPELQVLRESWGDENGPGKLWTPKVKEVALAEKAIMENLAKLKEKGGRVNLAESYIIQYYGLEIKKKKLIVCGIYKIEALKQNRGLLRFDKMLEALLTTPYSETDSDDWFDAYYELSEGKLSDTLGDLTHKNLTTKEHVPVQRDLTTDEKESGSPQNSGEY